MTDLHDGQERVEDGAAGVEDLVQEGNACGWQKAVCASLISIVLQGAHGQRAKELLCNGETGERFCKEPVLAALVISMQCRESAAQETLGRARGAEQEDVFPGEGGEDEHAGLDVALDDAMGEVGDRGGDAAGEGGASRGGWGGLMGGEGVQLQVDECLCLGLEQSRLVHSHAMVY